MIEEQERLVEEEKARKEQQEFDKWKALMEVEETGQDAAQDLDEEKKTKRMIEFIERRKVVMLEDVAAEFKMLTKDVVSRIEQLERENRLLGITDDRGKYIHVSQEEFDAVAGFIKGRGRINRSDLFQEANRLVRMQPTEADKQKLKEE